MAPGSRSWRGPSRIGGCRRRWRRTDGKPATSENGTRWRGRRRAFAARRRRRREPPARTEPPAEERATRSPGWRTRGRRRASGARPGRPTPSPRAARCRTARADSGARTRRCWRRAARTCRDDGPRQNPPSSGPVAASFKHRAADRRRRARGDSRRSDRRRARAASRAAARCFFPARAGRRRAAAHCVASRRRGPSRLPRAASASAAFGPEAVGIDAHRADANEIAARDRAGVAQFAAPCTTTWRRGRRTADRRCAGVPPSERASRAALRE